MIDLRKETQRAPLPAIDVGDLDAADLEAARTNWRDRMVSEHASARVFAELLAPMMRAGCPASETRRVAQMAEQEIEHGLLCARVLVALGADPVAALPPLDEVPRHDGCSPIEAVLRNVISIGCCSETVAVALVATERELAGPVRDVLDRILADEVKHSRFGWRMLARFAPALSKSERRSIDRYLVDVLAHQIRFHAPFLAMPNASRNGVAVGAPHGRSNWVVFVETMESIVVPGLEHAGFAARDAWEDVTRSWAPRATGGSSA
jgi:hypothetical protein